MTDESRLQRIEDKLDKMADIIAQQAVTQEQILTLTKRQDEHHEAGKDRDREVETIKGRLQALEDRQRSIIRVGLLVTLVVASVMTGINLL